MSTSLSFSKTRLHPNAIPNDITLEILSQCDTRSILAVRGVNKHFRDLIDQNERRLVGGIIRDRYAIEADLFERMGKQAGVWEGRHTWRSDQEEGVAKRPAFGPLSFGYLWNVEARNSYFFRELVDSVEMLGVLTSQACEMAVIATELSIIYDWPHEESVFAILASWSTSKIERAEACLNELAERGKDNIDVKVRSPCLKKPSVPKKIYLLTAYNQDFVNPYYSMPVEDRLPPSVTAEELEYYGIPAIYFKHCIMGRVWESENTLSLPYFLRGWWGCGYDYAVQWRWFIDMRLWVEYAGPDDHWGTLHVRFRDARHDPLKLFAALRSVPEGERLSSTWYEDHLDTPSASFRRTTFWHTPDTIWNWKGEDYGLVRLFFDHTNLDLYCQCNVDDPYFCPWEGDVEEGYYWEPRRKEPEELEEDQGIEEVDGEVLVRGAPSPVVIGAEEPEWNGIY